MAFFDDDPDSGTQNKNDSIPPISLAEFQQNVLHGIFENTYNIDEIGRAYYMGGDPFIAKRSGSNEPTEEDIAWFESMFDWGGDVSSIASLIASSAEFHKYNDWFWRSAKGIKHSTDLLRPLIETSKYKPGIQGLRFSQQYAKEAIKGIRTFGNFVAGVSILFTTIDISKNGITSSNSLDMFFGVITFVPGVGWMISGVYGVANLGTKVITGKNIGEHADSFFAKKGAELETGFRNLFWKLTTMSYGY